MIDGFVDGLNGKSAPFFWLIALVLVCGLVSNLRFAVAIGLEVFRFLRRLYRGEKTIASEPSMRNRRGGL